MAYIAELKHKTKTAAMVMALSGVSVVQAQEKAVSSSERETIRSEMQEDAKRADIIRENPDIYLEVKENIGQKLMSQLQKPVAEDNKHTPENETAIGPFPGFVIKDELNTKTQKYKSNFKSPKSEIKRETREIKAREDFNKFNNMAYFDSSDKKVHIPKWIVSLEMKKRIKKTLDGTWDAKLMTGDPTAEIAAERHEHTHLLHDSRGQTDTERLSFQTSDMSVEKDYMTEKLAYAVQCLTLANIWRNCKNSGMETIEIDGKKKNIGEIMSQIPGLRETVEQNSFDPASSESCSRIIHLASAHWDKNYLLGYSSSQFAEAALNGSSNNIMNQIRAAREHKKILSDMAKNLDIGYGIKIDIPPDCIEKMLPKTEITQEITAKYNWYSPSTDGLLMIDDYLDKCGLKNDKAKDAYLKEHYSLIVNRAPKADLTLKELMLKCGNKDNNLIYYTDNIQVRNLDGLQTISNDCGKTTYAVNKMAEKLDLTDHKDRQQEDAASGQKNTKTLTVTEISAAVQNGKSR